MPWSINENEDRAHQENGGRARQKNGKLIRRSNEGLVRHQYGGFTRLRRDLSAILLAGLKPGTGSRF
jgi:hypothetical protein